MRKLLVLLTALGAFPAAANASNLLVNGDFEASSSHFTTPPGWYNIGHTEGVISYAELGLPAFDGDEVYVTGGVSSSGFLNVGEGIGQNVATTVGDIYKLSFGYTGENCPGCTTVFTLNLGSFSQDYTIIAEDVAGPFTASIPTDPEAMSKLPRLGYASPAELLAEKFHMDEAFLKRLNPGADFGVAGTKIVVAALGPDRLPAPVARIEVDKAQRQVRAYGADETLLAVYPATVGSTDRPAPDGVWAVKGVSRDPTYEFDPSRLTFGKPGYGKLTIKPGPNNPVGSTWIALSAPTYGIHGAPDPRLVGKVASHGCVRLTNWDARQLADAVKPGVKVAFLGVEAEGGAPG